MNNTTITAQEQSGLVTTETLHRFQTIMSGFWGLISVTGVCTNFLNLRIFLRMGLDDTVTISFFALAVSDFCFCSFATAGLVPLWMFVIEREYLLFFYIPPVIAAFYIVCVRRIFNVTTVLITTFLAVQRCLCVVIPFHVKGVFTRLRTLCFMATIFTFSLICHALYIIRHRTKETSNMFHNATQIQMYLLPDSDLYLFPMEVVLGIAMNLVCQAVVVVCLVVMGIVLKRSARFRKSATATRSDETGTKETTYSKENQALIQVALVSVIFITTNIPYLGFGLTNLLIPAFGYGQQFNNLYHLFHNVMTTAELSNASINFVVYYKYNSKYRACFPSFPIAKNKQ